jgi:hypothetical protein
VPIAGTVLPDQVIVSTANESEWEATAVQNLTRYRASGTYFARFRIGKKLVWKSLKTTASSGAKNSRSSHDIRV